MAQAPFVQQEARQFGGYWLGRRLGAGGQGVVHEAYGPAGERVAVKLLRLDRGGTEEARVRFVREVAAARQVAPFCTAQVIAADLEAAQPYIVSEYVDGPSLSRAVRERGPYGSVELHRLATGVATALTAIHRSGVVHRDLKPENVVLGPDGPKVIDFGIARLDGATVTDDGVVPIGTPAYLSPERVRGERAGRAADVWAWGAVVLFAATGRPPFVADTPAATYHQIVTRRPDLSALDGTLRRLVDAAMSDDPKRRPEARELLAALLGRGDGTGSLLAAGSEAARAVRRPPEVRAGPAERPLGEVAEGVYTRLGPQEQALVPGLLLRLATAGDGPDDTLRWAGVGDLLDGTVPPDRVRRVLGAFVREDLLQQAGGSMTLAAPALIRAWDRMRGWVEEERERLRVHARLNEAATRWRANGRDPADLYHGSALRTALDWAAQRGGHLTANRLERAFLDASKARERAQGRSRRQVRAGVAALLAVVIGTVSILVARGTADAAQRVESAARRTAESADRLRATDPVTAMLLSVAAWRLAPGDPRVLAQLRGSLAQRELNVFRPPARQGAAVYDLSSDGSTLVAAGGGRATLYDVATHRLAGEVTGIGEDARVIALSPDGRTLAIGGHRSVRLWDLTTGRRSGPPFGMGASYLAFDATGGGLVTLSPAGEWRIWGLAGGGPPRLAGTATDLADLKVSGGTRIELLRDRGYRVRDVRGAVSTPGGSGPAKGVAAAVTPDGGTLALADGPDVRLWDLAGARWTGARLRGADPVAMSYNADGRYLATYDGSAVSVWSRDGVRLMNHPIQAVSGDPRFGAGDRTLACLLSDGTVVVLDLAGLTDPPAVVPRPVSGAFGPRAGYAALQGPEGTELLRPQVGAPPRRLGGTALPGTVMSFSADGRLLAVSTPDQARVAVWNVRDGSRERTLPIDADQVRGLAFGPANDVLAVAPVTGTWGDVQLWDARRGVHLETLAQPGGEVMAFSPDGRRLAVNGAGNSGVVTLSPRSVRHRPFGPDADGVLGLAFSPDGALVATGWSDVGVDLWNAATLTRARRLSSAGEGFDQFQVVAFSPDGRLLAAGGPTGRIWLWNVADGGPAGRPVPVHAGGILALAFAPDGGALHSLGADGALRNLPVTPSAVAAAVCARAGTTLSAQDWSRHIRDVPARKVC
ncbi:WD40 repeat domain-containing serine/threonine-protein kinase [Nonomuraea cavernae]|uniref:WD40 repeat domain-containing serine/threonine-protein kinase n=1 Tax=Nonomuraea cavernae TaxID=2045107 RepID=UPI0033FA9382